MDFLFSLRRTLWVLYRMPRLSPEDPGPGPCERPGEMHGAKPLR